MLDLNKKILFYENAKLINDSLYFSLYEYIENDVCNGFNCFCHYGKSYIYKYNFSLNVIELVEEFEEQTYVIDYGVESNYYYDGWLYINKVAVCSFDMIHPSGEYYVSGVTGDIQYKTKISDTYFVVYNGKIYYKHFTFEELMQDIYYN